METKNEHTCAVYAADVTVGGGSERRRQARLKEFSLSMIEGELVFVIGGSGSGKSALIRALAGLSALDSGEVLLGGTQAQTLRQKLPLAVTYLTSETAFQPELTPREILEHAGNLRLPRSVNSSARRDWLRHITKLTGLTAFLGEKAGRLNAGQRCRLALAEGLVGDPVFLFLDELTKGLDPFSDYELMGCLQTLARQHKKTILMSTQQMKSLSLCDRIVLLHEGRCPFQGTFDQLWDAHNTQSTRALFGCYHELSTRGAFSQLKLRAIELPPRPEPQPLHSSPPPGFICQVNGLLCQRAVLVSRRWHTWCRSPLIWICLGWFVFATVQNKTDPSAQNLSWMFLFLPILAGIRNGVAAVATEQEILRKEVQAGLSVGAHILAKLLGIMTAGVIQTLVMASLIEITGLASGGMIRLFLFLLSFNLTVSLLSLPIATLARSRAEAFLWSLGVFMLQIMFSGAVVPLTGICGQIVYPLNTMSVAFRLASHFLPAIHGIDAIQSLASNPMLSEKAGMLMFLAQGIIGTAIAWMLLRLKKR